MGLNSSIINTCASIAKVFGIIASFVPAQSSFLVYVWQRNFTTAKYQRRFMHFGKGSLLAPGVTLLTPRNISIGSRSSIMRHCVLETCECTEQRPELVIGNHVSIGEYSHVTCANSIKIGNGVLTGRFVLITDNSHGEMTPSQCHVPPLARPVSSKGPVVIGNNVWIGDKATILPGVTIGEGSVIAANAVVTSNIPPFSVAAGVPARVVKTIR